MLSHAAVKHTNCDVTGCPFCDGGLFACKVCGCAEGATTDDCPGVQITPWAMDEIYAGRLNFRDGAWRYETSEIWNFPGSPLYDPNKPKR